MNEHFTDWAAKKVATFSEITGRVRRNSNLAPNTRLVAYGRLDSAAAAFIVVFVNFFGLYSLYKDDRFLMAAHLCFSLAEFSC